VDYINAALRHPVALAIIICVLMAVVAIIGMSSHGGGPTVIKE
jgi:hypothetical protein